LEQSVFTRPAALLAALCLLAIPAVSAEQVLCHYTYGGETRELVAQPVSSPYTVRAIGVGSFFRFRVVFQKKPDDIAAIKIYTYAERDDGPLLIHQATFPYPPTSRPTAPYGFTGLHSVHEPVRDGELQYWCQLTSATHSGRSVPR